MKSQEALYRAYYAYSMSICLRYAVNRDEAVDIMNDAFIKVFQNIKTYDKTKPFKAWLRVILINTAIDTYRENITYKQCIEYSDTEEFKELDYSNDLSLEEVDSNEFDLAALKTNTTQPSASEPVEDDMSPSSQSPEPEQTSDTALIDFSYKKKEVKPSHTGTYRKWLSILNILIFLCVLLGVGI